MFNPKYHISLVSPQWVLIREVTLNVVPRCDENIFLRDRNIYYTVLRVIHQPKSAKKLVIVVKEYEGLRKK